MKRWLAVLAVLLFLPFAVAAKGPAVDDEIAALEQVIGAYPPHFASDKQKRDVIKTYKRVKARLDAAVKARPDDVEALYRRGILQSLGHNMDYSGAYAGAERDFRQVLDRDPKHQGAILDLADLWVNSSPELAPRAEMLYRAAQCLQGRQPLERAQRGMFFALYYQGRIEEAKQQTEYLVKQWPDQPAYGDMDQMVESVMTRQGRTRRAGDPPGLAPCG